VPTRFIGEQHVREDFGRIPTAQDWLQRLVPAPWMLRSGDCPDLTQAGDTERSGV